MLRPFVRSLPYGAGLAGGARNDAFHREASPLFRGKDQPGVGFLHYTEERPRSRTAVSAPSFMRLK